jgi:prepilin-type N-terminal cleavage/methylation domain-containing protein
MMRCPTKKGFSLIEMLVASLLLSAAVVVLCAISTRSMTGVKLNRQYETAWNLLDKQLTMIDYMGIDEFLELRQMSGQFDLQGVGQTVYKWEAAVNEGDLDNVYIVSVSISWDYAAREGRVSASTILNGQEVSQSSDESAEEQNNETTS